MTQTLVKHYEKCFEKHGDTAKGFDWPSEESASVRHRVMWEVADRFFGSSERRPRQILDFGCGSLQFLDWIVKNNYLVDYTGADLSDHFLAHAQAKYPTTRLLHLDVLNREKDVERLPNSEFIVCNGVFTLRSTIDEKEMDQIFEKIISVLWSRATKGLAFNLMSRDLVDWERNDLYFKSFSETAKFLKSLGAKNYIFRQDYGLYEYTTYVYK